MLANLLKGALSGGLNIGGKALAGAGAGIGALGTGLGITTKGSVALRRLGIGAAAGGLVGAHSFLSTSHEITSRYYGEGYNERVPYASWVGTAAIAAGGFALGRKLGGLSGKLIGGTGFALATNNMLRSDAISQEQRTLTAAGMGVIGGLGAYKAKGLISKAMFGGFGFAGGYAAAKSFGSPDAGFTSGDVLAAGVGLGAVGLGARAGLNLVGTTARTAIPGFRHVYARGNLEYGMARLRYGSANRSIAKGTRATGEINALNNRINQTVRNDPEVQRLYSSRQNLYARRKASEEKYKKLSDNVKTQNAKNVLDRHQQNRILRFDQEKLDINRNIAARARSVHTGKSMNRMRDKLEKTNIYQSYHAARGAKNIGPAEKALENIIASKSRRAPFRAMIGTSVAAGTYAAARSNELFGIPSVPPPEPSQQVIYSTERALPRDMGTEGLTLGLHRNRKRRFQ